MMEREEAIKDATSKETLEDVEENEKVTDKPGKSTLPSPDGAFDEPKEQSDADPM